MAALHDNEEDNWFSKFWAFFYTTVPVAAIFSLNYAACELEMPFGADPNDLPLHDFQEHMNASMLMLSRPETDIIPYVAAHCPTDHDTMKSKIDVKAPRDFIEDDEEDDFGPYRPIKTASIPRILQAQEKAHKEDHHEQHAVSAHVVGPSPAPTPSAASPKTFLKAPEKVEKAEVKTPAETKKPDVDDILCRRMSELSNKFDELMSHTSGLSRQLVKSTEELQRSAITNRTHSRDERPTLENKFTDILRSWGGPSNEAGNSMLQL